MGFQLVWHAGHIVHHGTCGVAGVGGRKRAVHDIHTLNFFGRDQAPARRVVAAVGDAIAQKIGEQNPVRIHGRARAIARARCAGGEDGVVVIADIALAHQQAGQVFEGVFAVRGVDAGLDFLAGDAFDGGRNLRGQRAGLAAVDSDHAKRAAALWQVGDVSRSLGQTRPSNTTHHEWQKIRFH